LDRIKNDSIDAILQVLLLTVFADRRAWDTELETVRAILPQLTIFAKSEIEIPEEGLDKLILRHAARVRALMDEEDMLGAIDTALRRITSPMLSPLVLAAMYEIASADANVHTSETNLIEQAEAIWNGNA